MVSIIIPVYKTEKYLEAAVHSVLNQTYKDIEIILVDDGSPDNSPELCDKLAEKYNSIKVIHKENGGLSSARNAGIENAIGEYLYFLDSDDTIINCAIEDMVEIIENEGSDVVFPNSYYKVYEDSGKKEIAYHFSTDLFKEKPLDYAVDILIGKARGHRSTAVLYRSDVIRENNIRFPIGLIAEDYFFMLDLMTVAKKLSIYTKPSLLNLKRAGSITSTYHEGFEETIWLMDKKAAEFLNKVNINNEKNMQKVDSLLCRSTVAYLFEIMSSRNAMPYKEKEKICRDLLNHKNTRKVWKKRREAPYFKSKKTRIAFALIYMLLRLNFISLALRIMSYS